MAGAKPTAAKKSKSKAKDASVENYIHEANKRKNIPTAEMQKLVPDEEKAIAKVRYPRNPDHDPQLLWGRVQIKLTKQQRDQITKTGEAEIEGAVLAWRGKDQEDAGALAVDAPPVYIQEKVHPRAIIEELRRRSKERRAEVAPQVDLFHDFNGLPDPEAKTEFYAHDQNWSNRMILGDALLVMASLAERENLRGKVQTVYLDPPYGIKFNSNWQPSTRTREVRDGRNESVSREPEVVRAFRDTWKDGIHSYLSYLRDRLFASRDLLANSGSVFVQIGDENLHRVRSVLDEVFGDTNFVSQISVYKTAGATSLYLSSVQDYILWYAKRREELKFRPSFKLKKFQGEGAEKYNRIQLSDLSRRPVSANERENPSLIQKDARIYRQDNITSQSVGREKGEGAASWFPVEIEGRSIRPSERVRWKTNQEGMTRLLKAGRVEVTGNSLSYVRFVDDFAAIESNNLWDDIGGIQSRSDPKIYVVQTPTKAIERCILMTTDPGDLVLDPTCGSGTTAYVAEQWGRRWITIDTSRVALTLARARLMGAKYDYYLLKDSRDGAVKEAELTGKVPAEGPFNGDVRQGFVYERAPHVTLKSIAINAEIEVIWNRWQATLEPLREKLNKALRQSWEEWQIPREADAKWPSDTRTLHAQWWEARRNRQKDIDASIARSASIEYLYHLPYRANGVVRVTGPFTVESLSPHRVLPLEEDPNVLDALGAYSDEDAAAAPTDFATVVYENLKASGVQNTKKGERLEFVWLRPFPSKSGMIQFEGRYIESGQEKRAAICIGPEYDTVGYDLVRRAAREAADLFDTLIVCGFAFAPEVDDSRLHFGALNVLRARMNQDLHMGERLKATGAGNLFVVFGEPDLRIEKLNDGLIQVEIKGMDIFDPTTGEVKSSTGAGLKDDVAAWFIDDNYDEESFFVRQAYFVGQDPYESLRRALKAEIDETAWADISSTISKPFPRPKDGKICVKVINHFGDEVQKVFVV
jgi:adenine-specific DNA-methyltransferase